MASTQMISVRLPDKFVKKVKVWSSRSGLSLAAYLRQVLMVYSSVEATRLGVFEADETGEDESNTE